MHEIKFIFILILFTSIISCQKDGVILPEEIPLETSLIYINGKIRNYNNYSYSRKLDNGKDKLFILFSENINNGQLIYTIGATTYWPLEKNEYDLTRFEIASHNTLKLSFIQHYEEDLSGPSYTYYDTRDDYFILEKYDTINQIISGRGQFIFKKDYPDFIQGPSSLDLICCEIAFNVTYEER